MAWHSIAVVQQMMRKWDRKRGGRLLETAQRSKVNGEKILKHFRELKYMRMRTVPRSVPARELLTPSRSHPEPTP
jgi:hypothetical protein